MFEQGKTTHLWLPAIITMVLLAVTATWTGCKKQAPEPNPNVEIPQPNNNKSEPNIENKSPVTNTNPSAEAKTSNKPTLIDIVGAARYRGYWGPVFTYWYGRQAPDFTLTDITGKKQKLSNHRGKNVIIVFWATWCGPCLMEIPHLIELRKTISEDDLAILGISYITEYPPNTAEMVKSFAASEKINYTVLAADIDDIGPPYSTITGIPCSFFIDPEGKIKLATSGLLSLGEIKAIIQADPL